MAQDKAINGGHGPVAEEGKKFRCGEIDNIDIKDYFLVYWFIHISEIMIVIYYISKTISNN